MSSRTVPSDLVKRFRALPVWCLAGSRDEEAIGAFLTRAEELAAADYPEAMPEALEREISRSRSLGAFAGQTEADIVRARRDLYDASFRGR